MQFGAPFVAVAVAVAVTLLVTSLLVAWAGAPVGRAYALLLDGGFDSRFAWSAAAGSAFDLADFNLDLGDFDARIDGTDTGFKRPGGQTVQTAVSGLGTLPTLRCDKCLSHTE